MRKLKFTVATAMLLSSMHMNAYADIYDILRQQQQTGADLNLQYAQANAAGDIGGLQQASADAYAPPPTTLRDEAFKELVNKVFPLKPEQIKELHRHYDQEQGAINSPPYAPPQPMLSTLTVDLSPGGTPPIIRLATGFVTSIVFVDTTGKPWPVADYSLGNPAGFNIKWDTKTNTLFVQSLKEHISGNVAIRLAELDTPVILSLVTGQKEVDYRIDLLVPGNGPNASAAVLDTPLPQGTSSFLLSTLDGVPPSGSVELKVAKDYGRAWIYNGKLLFRTKLTVLSPAWSAIVSSPDGTKVYELMQTPLILASQNGKTVKIELTGL